MPIEIRELVIKATVNEDGGQAEEGSASGSGEGSGADTEQIINICVEKVMEILKEKSER